MSFKEMLEDAAKLPDAAAKLNEFWVLELQEAERRYLANECKPWDVVCSWLDALDGTKHFGRFQPERLKKFRGGD